MGIYDPAAVDAEYNANDEGNWSGFVPLLSYILASDVLTLPTYPPRATGTLAARSSLTGNFTAKPTKRWWKLPMVKNIGTDDYTGKGNGGEHRMKVRIQHSLGNLKLIEDIAGIEAFFQITALDTESMLFGHKDYPAKIDRNSIKGTKGELTGESGGRYIEFELSSFPYSAYAYAGTISYTPAA